jgi:hypothetical protein
MAETTKKVPSIWKGALEFILILTACMVIIFAAANVPPLAGIITDLIEGVKGGAVGLFNN